MSFQPYSILIILIATMALFIWGRWRYDIVALVALMVAVAVGAVPFAHIYSGLSNTAVITVACVMIISQAIARSGVLAALMRKSQTLAASPTLHIASLSSITALLSAFMNNVGALGLMMPVAIKTAMKAKRSPSLVLMPIALASALGGLCTLIGTPPNLLISTYRQQYTGHPYSIFDYSYVGLPVAIVGIIFIAVLLWRFIPGKRKGPSTLEDSFQVQDYITEVRIPEGSPAIEKTVREFEKDSPADVSILGFIRNEKKKLIVSPDLELLEGDVLIIEATTEELEALLTASKLELVGNEKFSSEVLKANDIAIVEAVVPPGSRVEGRSSQAMRLRSRHHINLLAISREGKAFKQRLNQVNFRSGDVVLLQGSSEELNEKIVNLGFFPLVERGLQVTGKRRFLPLIIFAIAILLTVFQLLPVQVSFGAAVLFMALFNLIPVRKIYESIDWPIIILLAAMIPIGTALQSTGGTNLIVQHIVAISGQLSPVYIIGLLLIITMTLSDFMNNAATTVVMAPIAVSVAHALKVNIDPFLMTVALGASCSFLTPVGHQN
ncbi:MAG: SLC13 family permease, partial [Coxiellaceae bacterium]|nr:SLC13 family permease [Coxiellaceae bacterium]